MTGSLVMGSQNDKNIRFSMVYFIFLNTLILLFACTLVSSKVMAVEDNRIQVDFPPMMQKHMMANMRDHLQALQTITQHLSLKQYDLAADMAEQRLGMSSMGDHGAEHMGKLMPKEMAAIGTEMHHAASRFALLARDAAIDANPEKIFGALSTLMQQCVACHTAYKIH